MHTLTLITVDIPDTTEIKVPDDGIRRLVEAVFGQETDSTPGNIYAELIHKRLNCRRDAFSVAVDNAVAEKMDPYWEGTEDPRYLEFVDKTEDVKFEYENGRADFIRLPDGRFVPALWHGKFCIRDGQVYQKKAGQLRHEKRTKKAKKMKAYVDVPFTKVFKTLDDFATDYYGTSYHEDRHAYGYYTNPNSFWDWYSIGGRWPAQFLVKKDCPEYSIGERSREDEKYLPEAPEGYVWVVAARKKDIEWKVELDWAKKRMTERFFVLEKCFKEGKVPEGMVAQIGENGIGFFGEVYYVKDETLEENLKRYGYADDAKYNAGGGAFIDLDGAYCDRFDVLGPHEDREGWRKLIEHFVDRVDDNAVIVGVDCHV